MSAEAMAERDVISQQYRRARRIWLALLILYLPVALPVEIALYRSFRSMTPVLLFAAGWGIGFLIAFRRAVLLRRALSRQ
jgi:hypothetical protein